MKFETARDNLITLLGDNANGNFNVIGYPPSSIEASEIEGSNNTVFVYYKEGTFDQSASSRTSQWAHDCLFRIELLCSSASSGDLATLNNPNATPAQLTIAIANLQLAEYKVNLLFDTLVSNVFDILSDAQYSDLDGDDNSVGNLWITKVTKSDIPPENRLQGEYLYLPGVMLLECTLSEEPSGDEDATPLVQVESTIQITLDEEEEDPTSLAKVKEDDY